MEEPKVSIIMPVYNAEKYLPSCLKSVLNQNLQEIELLIVNNGSTDGSAQVLLEYAKKDERVRVFDIAINKGVGNARNFALAEARGKYIAFCDADDDVPQGTYSSMYLRAEKSEADIVVGNYIEVSDKSINSIRNISSASQISFAQYMRSGALWNRLFRREFLQKYQLCFGNFNYGEDTLFIAKAYSHSPQLAGVKNPVYRYMIRSNASTLSLARSRSSTALREYLQVEKEIAIVLAEKIKREELWEYIFQKTIYFRNYWWEITDIREKEKGFITLRQYVEELPEKLRCVVAKNVFLIDCDQFEYLSVSEYIAKLPAFNAKERVLEQYRQGEIGFRYLWAYFKAWLEYKINRKKGQ